MKLTHKLCGAALLAVAGVAVALPNNTKATDGDPRSAGADIEFTSTEITAEKPDPNHSGSGDGVPGNSSDLPWTDAKGFGVSAVTRLEFSKHAIVQDGKDQPYQAKKWVSTDEAGEAIENANFVSFEDLRVIDDHSYKITAKIAKPFTNSRKAANGKDVSYTLDGTTLAYSNMTLSSTNGAPAEAYPTTGLQEGATLSYDKTTGGAPVVMLDNTNTASLDQYEKGAGKYNLYFGQYGSTEKDPEKSVLLTIPTSKNIMQEGKYSGVVEWTMASIPTTPKG
ncbi:hypothetical protein UAY_00125 [Enterococcus moraviensis ATCC BAA-383]|uniref:Uncharacterized protein n=2 Tax=Enterococcus TaxID=1350 RepID=R2T482_9ENTE|nr:MULTISPECIES: WxL domain-containing protein [Enterococcus]EOH95044.1 hypothetical protein UAW_02123 [Enterococcus haemoperoxidus ATCC BAA-382]EOI06783.1 hypothetical protein UAY_00125 [Enterococcus moraviensis ATCC BAA-383]EOT60443.1 hypothetical protein I583_03089 [Enterococcus haemoperoxidus ATCC BAA-382]EOT65120.1 hypothetical protein I586_02854 [Enterococcus moraviensis ATCC BAA-383]OJG54875.1 hypothetical protein RV06_GL002397 [Enterococcus haemoperoxidus]